MKTILWRHQQRVRAADEILVAMMSTREHMSSPAFTACIVLRDKERIRRLD